MLKEQQGQSIQTIPRPQSEKMLSYHATMNDVTLLNQNNSTQVAQMPAALQGLTESAPNYKRNRVKICSFWVKGACNRGEACPFRHEQSDHLDESLAKQHIKDRYYGINDPLAEKILNRYNNDKKKESGEEITSVCITGINSEKPITEKDLHDYFYSFGEILKIKLVPDSKCAFVEYPTHSEAAKAIETLRNNLVIRGQFLKVNWAKSQVQDPDAPLKSNLPVGFENSNMVPPPPGYLPPNVLSNNQSWAPMYYPSMNPNRMGAYDSSESHKKNTPSQTELDAKPNTKRIKSQI